MRATVTQVYSRIGAVALRTFIQVSEGSCDTEISGDWRPVKTPLRPPSRGELFIYRTRAPIRPLRRRVGLRQSSLFVRTSDRVSSADCRSHCIRVDSGRVSCRRRRMSEGREDKTSIAPYLWLTAFDHSRTHVNPFLGEEDGPSSLPSGAVHSRRSPVTGTPLRGRSPRRGSPVGPVLPLVLV